MTAFEKDIEFLSKHTDIVILENTTQNSKVAVAPAYQGRVMTSTAGNSTSFGWINKQLIESGQLQEHINVFGGEDRFWMGPEGGQYSIFFENNAPFDLDHWYTPAVIDTEAFDITEKTEDSVRFEKNTKLKNFSNYEFDLKIERSVKILATSQTEEILTTPVADQIHMVGYESENTLTNISNNDWKKETGLLSIWILGMYNPSAGTTIVIPFKSGNETELGQKVNDSYFGKIPADRLVVQDDVLFFKGDGNSRGKIGISPKRAKDTLGSFDADNGILTIIQYNRPADTADYVNSMWEMQKEPFAGDVVNSYNDGPPTPGAKPLGPFYELETSSPALALKSGQSYTHLHRTFHFAGEESKLDTIAKKCLGVTLEEIKQAF